MYYTVYLITNKKNGRFYIGKHQTKDLDMEDCHSNCMVIKSLTISA
jgi:predicted GIY-YIG superfamily endonuclease